MSRVRYKPCTNKVQGSCRFEVVTQLDDRGGVKHASFIQDKLTMLKQVDVALDEQKVRATLHSQESAPWNFDTMSCQMNKV
jgi:hypothetical protein